MRGQVRKRGRQHVWVDVVVSVDTHLHVVLKKLPEMNEGSEGIFDDVHSDLLWGVRQLQRIEGGKHEGEYCLSETEFGPLSRASPFGLALARSVGEVVKLDSTPVDEVEWVRFVEGGDRRRYYAPVR